MTERSDARAPWAASGADGEDARVLESGRTVRSEDLFLGGREIVIVHRGMRYRLLQTKQGKLILNK